MSIPIFMLLIDSGVVNVALPDIQSQLHATFANLERVVNAYALTLAALRAEVGRAARSAFATGLDEVLWITGVVALVGAPCLVLIRRRDLVSGQGNPPATRPDAPHPPTG
ncbi:MAG: hypothetical protein ACRDZQ_11115 [Acidimicrobiales bacterium]